ncbi:MAG: hypothetical protein AAGJ46_02805 [Planctomycetota bacterium]
MWRSLFLAIGAYAAILGAEALAIEKAVLKPKTGASGQVLAASQEVVPPDWAPWSLLAGGAVIVLYSFTIPRRVSE